MSRRRQSGFALDSCGLNGRDEHGAMLGSTMTFNCRYILPDYMNLLPILCDLESETQSTFFLLVNAI